MLNKLRSAMAIASSGINNMLLLKSYSNSTIASTSTGTPNGKAFVPTADRACFPASPNTSTITSEHPFMTNGC